MSHTPGPWRLVDRGERDGTTMDLIAANDQILVRGIGNSFLTYGETESGLNARLIAAAPDLLDALRWIIRELPTSRNWLDPDCERACKAAIAKAEGKA